MLQCSRVIFLTIFGMESKRGFGAAADAAQESRPPTLNPHPQVLYKLIVNNSAPLLAAGNKWLACFRTFFKSDKGTFLLCKFASGIVAKTGLEWENLHLVHVDGVREKLFHHTMEGNGFVIVINHNSRLITIN